MSGDFQVGQIMVGPISRGFSIKPNGRLSEDEAWQLVREKASKAVVSTSEISVEEVMNLTAGRQIHPWLTDLGVIVQITPRRAVMAYRAGWADDIYCLLQKRLT